MIEIRESSFYWNTNLDDIICGYSESAESYDDAEGIFDQLYAQMIGLV